MQVPAAIPDDGLFDVTLIKKAPKWMVIRHASKLYDGTLVKLPIVETYRGKSIRIRSIGKNLPRSRRRITRALAICV